MQYKFEVTHYKGWHAFFHGICTEKKYTFRLNAWATKGVRDIPWEVSILRGLETLFLTFSRVSFINQTKI